MNEKKRRKVGGKKGPLSRKSPGSEKKVRWAAGWRWVDIFVHIHRVFATLRATSVDISLVRTGRVQLFLCTKASKKSCRI